MHIRVDMLEAMHWHRWSWHVVHSVAHENEVKRPLSHLLACLCFWLVVRLVSLLPSSFKLDTIK